MNRQILLSGAEINANERRNKGIEKTIPTTGMIKNPKNPSANASGSNIIPITLLENFSDKQSYLFIDFFLSFSQIFFFVHNLVHIVTIPRKNILNQSRDFC